jgi:hypothetical protein
MERDPCEGWGVGTPFARVAKGGEWGHPSQGAGGTLGKGGGTLGKGGGLIWVIQHLLDIHLPLIF